MSRKTVTRRSYLIAEAAALILLMLMAAIASHTVKSLQEATHSFERLGFSVGKQIPAPQLGTVAQEVALGKASLTLLMTKEKRTETANEDTADSGIACVSIMVQDLEAARAVIRARSGRALEVHKDVYGNSVSIPAALAHGIAIELAQNAR